MTLLHNIRIFLLQGDKGRKSRIRALEINFEIIQKNMNPVEYLCLTKVLCLIGGSRSSRPSWPKGKFWMK